jgi:hypothetical protein
MGKQGSGVVRWVGAIDRTSEYEGHSEKISEKRSRRREREIP